MTFSSIHFIFIFLPLALILFYIVPFRGWKNFVLVLSSLAFFAWTDPTHIPILIITILANYVIGMLIWRGLEEDKNETVRIVMWVGTSLNVFLLIFYRYTGFLASVIADITKVELTKPDIAAPLGISYLTFSSLSYILDIYKGGEKAEKNFLRFTAYLIMFPKFIQGPITRYKEVRKDLKNFLFDIDNLIEGARRFMIGLAKKVILADSLAVAANRVFNANYKNIGMGVAWMGLISYALQLYFDFSGYTDMAIGLGKMFGFKLPENFNFPYISKSITDFWRRWHMSLGAWFRTYVFIPLEFSRKKVKHLRQQTNILIVFLLTGLWHGPSWNFVLWGAYYGIIQAIEASGWGKVLKRLPVFVQHFYSVFLVVMGWMMFRITDTGKWGAFLKALFGGNGWTNKVTLRYLNIMFYLPFIIIGIFFTFPFIEKLLMKLENKRVLRGMVEALMLLALFGVSISFILTNGFSAFLYEQF